MIKKLKPKSEFVRNTLTLMTGTTIAQGIGIAISPILTRIYTPEDFGVFALYASVVSIVYSFVCGKYELAIMLPKDKKSAIDVFMVSIFVSFIVFFISLIVFLFFRGRAASFIGDEGVLLYLIIAAVSILLSGIYQSLRYLSNRDKEYGDMSKSTVYQSLSSAGLNVALGYYMGGAISLMVSQMIGQVIAALTLSKNIIVRYRELFKNAKMSSIIYAAKRYKRFPLFFSLSDGLNAVVASLVPFILTASFGAQYAGYYFLLRRVIVTPSMIIGSSIKNVFYQKATTQKDCTKAYVKISFLLFLSGLAPTVVIFAWGSDIFSFIFGGEWRVAGEMASLFVIMFFFSFCTTIVGQFSTIYQKVMYNILWQVSLLAIVLVAWYFGDLYNDLFLFIYIYVGGQVFLYLFGYVYEYHLCKRQACGLEKR